jgi:hypothetical protein
MKPRGMTVMAFKVTLETPEGAQEIECADDTYVLDAAEVRARSSNYIESHRRRASRASANARYARRDAFAGNERQGFFTRSSRDLAAIAPIRRRSGLDARADRPIPQSSRARSRRRPASISRTLAARAPALPARARSRCAPAPSPPDRSDSFHLSSVTTSIGFSRERPKSARGPPDDTTASPRAIPATDAPPRSRSPPRDERRRLARSTSPTSPSSTTTRWATASSSPASPTPPPTAPSRPTWCEAQSALGPDTRLFRRSLTS